MKSTFLKLIFSFSVLSVLACEAERIPQTEVSETLSFKMTDEQLGSKQKVLTDEAPRFELPKDSVNSKKGMFAVIMTNKGEITLRLYFKRAPLTVANFVALAEGLVVFGFITALMILGKV